MLKRKKKGTIELPFVPGQWIRKTSNTLFGRNEKRTPVLRVKEAYSASGIWVINYIHIFKHLKEITFISSEEAKRLKSLYESIELNEPIDQSVEKTCFTMYTGERTEKVKYKSENYYLKSALYHFRVNRPEDHFIAYKCPNCGFYHIGREEIILK